MPVYKNYLLLTLQEYFFMSFCTRYLKVDICEPRVTSGKCLCVFLFVSLFAAVAVVVVVFLCVCFWGVGGISNKWV